MRRSSSCIAAPMPAEMPPEPRRSLPRPRKWSIADQTSTIGRTTSISTAMIDQKIVSIIMRV